MKDGLIGALAAFGRRAASIIGVPRIFESFRRRVVAASRVKIDPWTTIAYDRDKLIRIDKSSYIGSAIYCCGYHSLHEIALLKRLLKSSMVFADIGANLGEFTLCAAGRIDDGRVLAFEPFAPAYGQLVKNVELNRFINVSTFNIGLSDAPGEMDIFAPHDSSPNGERNEGLASFYPGPGHTATMGKVKVDTLDFLLANQKVTRLDIVKIDAEGSELPVLRGAVESLKRYRPSIIMEMNQCSFARAGYSSAEVLSFLRDLGYTTFRIGWKGRLVLLPFNPVRFPSLFNMYCRPA